jgi:hypothetical protein
LASSPDVVTSAPVFADDISNLAGLLTIGETIWG